MKKCSPPITTAIALTGIVALVALSSCNNSQKPAQSDQPAAAASESSSIVTSAVFTTDQTPDSTGNETNFALPDLVVRLCTAPSPDTRGSQITVSAIVSNTSALATAGSSRVCFYLNTSSNVTGASFLGSYITGALGLHGSYTNSETVTVPTNQPTGLNYFLAVCDCSNNVNEGFEWNNTNEVAVTIN